MPLSGHSQGRLTATLSAHSGLLTVFGTQPLRTSGLIGVRHTKTPTLGLKHPPLPRTLLRTHELCSLAFVMPLALGSIPCLTPHSSPFSFEAVEHVLFLTLSRRELGLRHCSPLRSSPGQSPLFLWSPGTPPTWIWKVEYSRSSQFRPTQSLTLKTTPMDMVATEHLSPVRCEVMYLLD